VIAATASIILTGVAFWLSYEHLHDVAHAHGLADAARAWAWPATVDLFVIIGEVLMLRAALAGRTDAWAVFLTVAGSGGSIGLNVAGVGTDASRLDYVVAAVPPVAALLAFGAIMRQIHGALVPRVAEQPVAPVVAPRPATATQPPAARPAAAAAPATAKPARSVPAPAPKPATPAAQNATPEPAPAATPKPDTVKDERTFLPGYQPGSAHQIVFDLWASLGDRPSGPDIVKALGDAGLPNSPQQARKIRSQVGHDNPNLPGLKAA
jgi:hypothetical protein